jgi:hypothetical protein
VKLDIFVYNLFAQNVRWEVIPLLVNLSVLLVLLDFSVVLQTASPGHVRLAISPHQTLLFVRNAQKIFGRSKILRRVCLVKTDGSDILGQYYAIHVLLVCSALQRTCPPSVLQGLFLWGQQLFVQYALMTRCQTVKQRHAFHVLQERKVTPRLDVQDVIRAIFH